jgi:hypothetical protein
MLLSLLGWGDRALCPLQVRHAERRTLVTGPVAAANDAPKLKGGPFHRADAKGSLDRNRSPEKHGPADCAFCACTSAQTVQQLFLCAGRPVDL